MDEDDQNWPPKPLLDTPRQPNPVAEVSPVPLGIASCVLSAFLSGAHVAFWYHSRQMSLQEMISSLVTFTRLGGTLQGAEIIGIPVALFLGLLSRRTLAGKVGLVITGAFLCVALYAQLFGLPFLERPFPGGK